MRRAVKERIVLLTLVLVLLIVCSCTVIEVKDEKEELDLILLPQSTNYEDNIPPQQHRVKV